MRGVKVNPIGMRVGIIRDWRANGMLINVATQTYSTRI